MPEDLKQPSRLPEAARPVPQIRMYSADREERGRFGGAGARVPSRETDPRITRRDPEDFEPKLPYRVLAKSYQDDVLRAPGATVYLWPRQVSAQYALIEGVDYPPDAIPPAPEGERPVPRFGGGWLAGPALTRQDKQIDDARKRGAMLKADLAATKGSP